VKAILATLMLLSLVFVAGPAEARDPDPYFDGSVNVVAGKGIGESVFISRDRCCGGEPRGPYASIYPGHSSKEKWPDTDLMYVPAGRDIRYGYWTSYGWQQSGAFTQTGWAIISSALYVWVVAG
jgi:hypothetical protein